MSPMITEASRDLCKFAFHVLNVGYLKLVWNVYIYTFYSPFICSCIWLTWRSVCIYVRFLFINLRLYWGCADTPLQAENLSWQIWQVPSFSPFPHALNSSLCQCVVIRCETYLRSVLTNAPINKRSLYVCSFYVWGGVLFPLLIPVKCRSQGVSEGSLYSWRS